MMVGTPASSDKLWPSSFPCLSPYSITPLISSLPPCSPWPQHSFRTPQNSKNTVWNTEDSSQTHLCSQPLTTL
jgi:hypothetical protein